MSLEIVPVEGRRLLSEFVDVPWRIPAVADDPRWVPPLRMMVRDNLDTKRNPFYWTADRALFVARRAGKTVGRIAAIENRAHNEFHGDRVGFFGFFESVNDPDVATKLVREAEAWLRARGLTSIRGPVNPSTNHDCGLLVEGFDHPQFLTTWNPEYYEQLLTGAGLAPTKDLLGYWLTYGEPGFDMARLTALADRVRGKTGIAFRDLNPKRFWDEVEMCWQVYNAAWEKNWGFVPMTRDEFMYQAKDFKSLIEPQFAFVADVGGKPAGFMLAVLDFNLAIKQIGSGRLLPFGFLKFLTERPKIRTGRIMALGVMPEFRSRGIFALFMHEAIRRAIAFGSPGAEASWILEDNANMRQPLEATGARLYRRWRIYDRELAEG